MVVATGLEEGRRRPTTSSEVPSAREPFDAVARHDAALELDETRREEQRRRCAGSGAVLRQRAWQLRTAPARTGARGRRTALLRPAFSRTRGDRRALPHSANEGTTGGDTEADRRVPPATFLRFK
jgi:hypothetical protein